MKTFFALYPKARIQVTEQGRTNITVLVRDKYTGEMKGERSIKRALLAYMLHSHQAHSVNGQFCIEV